MMNEEELNKEEVSNLGIALSLYFLPAALLSLWAQYIQDSWSILCFGLLTGTLGSFLLYLLIRSWDQPEVIKVQESLPQASVNNSIYIQQIESLQQAVKDAEDHNEEYINIKNKSSEEKELLLQQQQALEQEFLTFKETVLKEVDHKQSILVEQQRTIAELRETLEAKQQHMAQLESKTRDLNYELKVLLQLTEDPLKSEPKTVTKVATAPLAEEKDIHIFDFAVRTQEEAHVHLKRILDVAQRVTGTSPFSVSSRFKDLPLDNYALDIRRLLDCLKEVSASTIFLFSLKENKLLFVNDHVQELLGMSADKFVQAFQDNVQEEWQEALRQLNFKNEAKVYLNFESGSNGNVSVEALISPVPTGIFKNHLIGILYPSGRKY